MRIVALMAVMVIGPAAAEGSSGISSWCEVTAPRPVINGDVAPAPRCLSMMCKTEDREWRAPDGICRDVTVPKWRWKARVAVG
jgi:hypothetical protein